MKQIAVLLIAWAAASGMVLADTGPSDPRTVTKEAYATALQHFGFSPEIVRAQKPYLAPALYAALLKKANQPVPKGDAPDVEGDLLFDSQDQPDRFGVWPAAIGGNKATVPVTLAWGSEKRRYVVQLVQIDGAWKITDIDYGKDGKLTDLLK